MASTNGGSEPSIVLIDDDERVRRACEELLSAAGYDVTAAGSAMEGIRAIRTGRPDLVVTDIVLPDLDGRDVVRILRANAATRDIPVVAATGESSIPGPGDDGLFAAVLHKPYAARRLLAIVSVMAPLASN